MLAEDPKRTGDTAAVKYAKQAIDAATPDDMKDPAKKLSLGLAHGAIGWVDMKQEKTPPAIAELKQAAELTEGNDAAYSVVMYRLGFAYAKLKQYGEAKAALNKCSEVEGPYKDEAKKLLVKVNAAAPKK
jgi:tetratricopeptide (TPR) repeat protein